MDRNKICSFHVLYSLPTSKQKEIIAQKQKHYFEFSCRLLHYPSAEVTQSIVDYKLHEHGKIKDDVNLLIKPSLEPRCGFQH